MPEARLAPTGFMVVRPTLIATAAAGLAEMLNPREKDSEALAGPQAADRGEWVEPEPEVEFFFTAMAPAPLRSRAASTCAAAATQRRTAGQSRYSIAGRSPT